MKFALISFSFNGGLYFERKVLFKTDVEGLVKGDVVVVKGKKEKKSLGVFLKYIEEDLYPEYDRKVLLKKAHKNALEKTMKKQVRLFEHLYISESVCKKYRERFKNNEGLSDEEVRVKIIRNLSVAAHRVSSKKNIKKNIKCYFFGNMVIVLQGNEVINIKHHDKDVKWVCPNLLKEIAEQHIKRSWDEVSYIKKATGATAALNKK